MSMQTAPGIRIHVAMKVLIGLALLSTLGAGIASLLTGSYLVLEWCYFVTMALLTVIQVRGLLAQRNAGSGDDPVLIDCGPHPSRNWFVTGGVVWVSMSLMGCTVDPRNWTRK